jgi:hypothetical protein
MMRLLLSATLLCACAIGCKDEGTATAPPTEPVPGISGTPVGPTDRSTAEFDALITEVSLQIQQKEYEAAETGLRELERMSESMPEGSRQRVADLRASLESQREAAAESSVGISTPETTRPAGRTPPADEAEPIQEQPTEAEPSDAGAAEGGQ